MDAQKYCTSVRCQKRSAADHPGQDGTGMAGLVERSNSLKRADSDLIALM